MAKKSTAAKGTPNDPWVLKTPPMTSECIMHRDVQEVATNVAGMGALEGWQMPRWVVTAVFALTVLLAVAYSPSVQPTPANAAEPQIEASEIQYLAFQVFTGSPDTNMPIGGEPLLGVIPSHAELDAFASRLIARVGETGTADRRLALMFGPVAFDHTDAQVASLIASIFDIALARDVAVGIHVDDSMFWGRRIDLLADAGNIERGDWDGVPSTARLLAWGPTPSRAPPQMCINSPAIETEARRRGAEVIGAALRAGIERLRDAGKEELFAGVIMGWETQIGRNFDDNRVLGYCALANRGLQRGASREAMDHACVAAVQHFISLWSDAIASAGVPAARIYSHIAFVPVGQVNLGNGSESYAEHINFSPIETAFGTGHRAGFSTYPQPNLFEEIYQHTSQGNGTPWASAEGANVALGGDPTASGMSMETYLARLFNHGASLVNIFGWGVGSTDNGFRRAAENQEAILAYRKFLLGQPLVEGPVEASILTRLPAKIHRIQAELPAWISRHDGRRAQPHLNALEAAFAVNNLERAEVEADALLMLLDED